MLSLKLKSLKEEIVINRQGSDEKIRLFLGNHKTPNLNMQVKLNADIPNIYGVSRLNLKNNERGYEGCSVREGGEPLILCRKDPLWIPGSYERGIPNLCLKEEEILVLYFGKKGKVGREIPVNIYAPSFETLNYEVLQNTDALKNQEVRELRQIVDYKILKRLREAA